MQPKVRRSGRGWIDSRGVRKDRRAPFRSPSVEVLESRALLAVDAGGWATALHPGRLAADGHRPIGAEVASHGVAAAGSPVSDTILHNFGGFVGRTPDGWQPWGSLTPVQTAGGMVLFGRTLYGGTSNDGVIFMMNPDGSDYQIVHSFAGGADDGSQPHHDQMRQVGNTLYGATLLGGQYNDGVIYSINTDGSGFQVLHSFAGSSNGDGSEPHSNPMPMPGTSVLYGLTSHGGKHNDGVIYQINTDGSGYQVLHSFEKSDGTDPHGFVTISGDDLYGMTREDGGKKGHDEGSIFSFDVSDDKYTDLHNFKGGPDDGASPDHGGLVLVGNELYGVTTNGGAGGSSPGDGVLFSIDTTPDKHGNYTFQVLHSFGVTSGDGTSPHGSLTLVGSTLYGMTSDGGADGDGTIFEIGTNGKDYQTIDSFAGPTADGQDGLDNVLIWDSSIYGMTKYGGSIATSTSNAGQSTYDAGVIFRLPLPSPAG